MCHWDKRAGAGRRDQSGFSLIEVMVAVGLLVVVLVALLPELVVGIRATAGAKNLSQAKGVLQGRLEGMRAMPYHVGRERGDYVDLLDTYYPDLVQPTPAPACSPGGLVGEPQAEWSGFVPAGGTNRCTYEPPLGAFYRKVIPNITAPGLGTFTLVVDSAFLDGSIPPAAVAPGSGYDSQTAGEDTPESGLLGVWATVVYRQSSGLKPVSTYTQISARNPVDSSLELAATVNTVRVASQTPFPSTLITLDAGVVAQSGARFTGSSVNVNANAASAGSGTGASADGAKATLSAPASAVQATTTDASGWLIGWFNGNCRYVCFGETSVEGASVKAEDGLPLSALPSAPVRVAASSGTLSPGYSSSKYGGFWFNNDPGVSGPGFDRGLRNNHPMVTLDANDPGVSYVQSGCTSPAALASGNLFSASGFLASYPVSDTSPAVWSCVTARSAPIMLFPTDWAPDGVIRVTLGQSSLQCKVVRTLGVRTATATARFSAKVEYWNGLSYSLAGSVTEPGTVVQLVPLSTPVGHGVLTLGDFIQSWRVSTSGDVKRTTPPPGPEAGKWVRAKIPGVVSIDSTPTRQNDLNSVVSVTVGTFTCDAKDVR